MQQLWRNRWRNVAWALLSAGTLALLIAAVYKKKNKLCTGVEVVFNGDGTNYFIGEKDVLDIMTVDGALQGREISGINLRVLENRLEHEQWVHNAELFFDNRQVLQVRVQEKEPVARVFTAAGSSFYIDSACRRLPLSEKLSARIPMFTGFPSDRQVLSKPDSQLLAEVKDLARFIEADSFWNAQVAQVDITPGGFEVIPTIGNHVVVLGKGGDYQKKFDRLYSFYKQVWPKVGLEKYDKLDVQFDGQVVATFKGSAPVLVDTAKAQAMLNSMVAKDKADTISVTSAPLKGVTNDSAAKAGTTTGNLKKGLPSQPKTAVAEKKEQQVQDAVLKSIALSKANRQEIKTPVQKTSGTTVQRENSPSVVKPKATAPKAVMKKEKNTVKP